MKPDPFVQLNTDFNHPWNTSPDLIDFFKNKNIYITGATGFFGKWLLGTFNAGHENFGVQTKIFALSRNPDKFLSENPFFKTQNIQWIQADVHQKLDFNQNLDFIIHGATEASEQLNREKPDLMFSTILKGTENILNLAEKNLKGAFLNLSSGAIYGPQPAHIDHIQENHLFGPDITNPLSAYAEGKRVSEFLSTLSARRHPQLRAIQARCFAFVGPFLPLGTHFAMGNFLLNALNKEDIQIKGDGTPRRSYLYMSDLSLWLLKILALGKNQMAYNVGSEQGVSIKELAEVVAEVSYELTGFRPQIQIAQKASPDCPPLRYVPSTEKVQKELGLSPLVPLRQAIAKTMSFHLNQ